jgi:hypothetical protein
MNDAACYLAVLVAMIMFFKIINFVRENDDTIATMAKYQLISRMFETANTPFRTFCVLVIGTLALLKGGLKFAVVAGGLTLATAIVGASCSTALQLLLGWLAQRFFT